MRRTWTTSLATLVALALGSQAAFGQQLLSEVIWTGTVSNDWNNENNWNPMFVPSQPAGGERANINNGGMPFINSAIDPVAGLRIDNGSLEIRSGSTLDVVTDMQLDDPDEGIAFIGGSGRGQLNVLSGGGFNPDSLVTRGAADSTFSMAGNATMEVTNDARLERITRITGPNVSAEVGGDLRLGGTFIPEITGLMHSTIQVPLGNAALGGTLRPEFSGGFVPNIGNTWTLISADSVSGSFASVDASQAPSLPRGVGFVVTVTPSSDVMLSLTNQLLLTVDRDSGAMTVENVVGDAIEIDGYSIGSPGGRLDPGAWQSLQDGGQPGWEEANPTSNFLSELNPQASQEITVAGGPIDMGNAFSFTPSKIGEIGADLTFEYTGPGGGVVAGIIEYTGRENNLVLSVDPATGQGTLINDSTFSIDLLGYTVRSASGALEAGTWTSLADQGEAGWQEANPTANGLSELNLDNSKSLAGGTSVNLGNLFDTAGSRDLSLEFFYESAAGPVGDTNGDGKVDIDDLNNVRNLFGTNDPGGDTNGDGIVNIDDLNNVRNNFGLTGGGGGGASEVLFGIVKYESLAPAPVPEPATWMLLGIGLIGLALRRNAMKLGIWTGSLAAVAVLLSGATAQAALNDVVYVTTANGGVGGPDGVVGVDGKVEGDMTGVGQVTLLDKDGNDMWNNGDDFIYLFDNQRVTGAFTATVRVVGQTEAIDGRWGKGGIRASRDLTASSAFGMAQVAAGNGSQAGGSDPIPVRLAGRTTHGANINPGTTGGMFENNVEGSPNDIFAAGGSTPTWLRLSYRPFLSQFSAEWAPDVGGAPGAWSDPALATNSVPVGNEGVFVGLAYSAHDDLNFGQVTRGDMLHGMIFDNYSLQNVTPPPVTPDFTIPAGTKSFDTDHPLTGRGDGLEGTWWKFNTGNMLANAQAAVATEAIDGQFVATQLDYVRGGGEGAGGGTAISSFLSPDPVHIAPGSSQSQSTSSNDSFWRFTGFIDIRAEHDALPDQPGLQVAFAMPSDDATNIVIGGVEVLNNDGGHGFPGGGAGPVVVEFAEPGVYSYETFLTQGGGGFGLELLTNIPGTNVNGRFGLTDTPPQSILFTQAGIFPDFNGDGNVDNLDFNVMRNNFLTGTTFAEGDMNRDFQVNLQDFQKFREIFNILNAAPAAVPEPGSLVLLGLAALGLIRVRRRR